MSVEYTLEPSSPNAAIRQRGSCDSVGSHWQGNWSSVQLAVQKEVAARSHGEIELVCKERDGSSRAFLEQWTKSRG